jgi:signal transduction histidine kinase
MTLADSHRSLPQPAVSQAELPVRPGLQPTTDSQLNYSAAPVLGSIFKPVQGPMTLRRCLLGILAGTVILAAVAWLDLLTGPTVFLGPVYLFGVVIAAWFGGRWAGYFLNFITTGVWLWTVIFQETPIVPHPLHLHDWVVNGIIRLAFFASMTEIVVLLQAIERRLEAVVEVRTVELRQEIGERLRTEAAMRNLAAQLSAAEDVERRRIAYDIHDALSQMLGLAKMNLETTVAETAIDTRQYTRLVNVVSIVDKLIHQTRELTFDLHPSMLDHFGLFPTLERYGEDYGRQVSAEISVVEIGQSLPIPSALSSYLFRALKETISNAIKHGLARQIVVTFHWSQDGVRFVVDDDGCGFDTVAAMTPQARRGLGLAGIGERLASLGGRLRLESQRGNGTRVIMEVPLCGQPA